MMMKMFTVWLVQYLNLIFCSNHDNNSYNNDKNNSYNNDKNNSYNNDKNKSDPA